MGIFKNTFVFIFLLLFYFVSFGQQKKQELVNRNVRYFPCPIYIVDTISLGPSRIVVFVDGKYEEMRLLIPDTLIPYVRRKDLGSKDFLALSNVFVYFDKGTFHEVSSLFDSCQYDLFLPDSFQECKDWVKVDSVFFTRNRFRYIYEDNCCRVQRKYMVFLIKIQPEMFVFPTFAAPTMVGPFYVRAICPLKEN